MYEIYSQQRPGRPRWALGASAALLLLTVGLAAALVQYKTGPNPVLLQPFESPAFEGKRPIDWKAIEDGLPAGTDAAFAEPTPDKTTGRLLFIFHRPVVRRQVVRDYVTDIFRQNVSSSGSMIEEALGPRSANGQVAGFEGVAVKYKLQPRKGPAVYCLIRTAAIGPTHIIGVALLTRNEPGKADDRLLDRVCRELQVRGPEPSMAPIDGDDSAKITADARPGS